MGNPWGTPACLGRNHLRGKGWGVYYSVKRRNYTHQVILHFLVLVVVYKGLYYGFVCGKTANKS